MTGVLCGPGLGGCTTPWSPVEGGCITPPLRDSSSLSEPEGAVLVPCCGPLCSSGRDGGARCCSAGACGAGEGDVWLQAGHAVIAAPSAAAVIISVARLAKVIGCCSLVHGARPYRARIPAPWATRPVGGRFRRGTALERAARAHASGKHASSPAQEQRPVITASGWW